MTPKWLAALLALRLSIVFPVLAMLCIIVLSSVPGTIPEDAATVYQVFNVVPPTVQNLMHIPVYAALAFLWRWGLADRYSPMVATLAALLITVGFGVIDEWYQSFIPGRYSTLNDVVLNGVGAVLGLFAFHLLDPRRREREA